MSLNSLRPIVFSAIVSGMLFVPSVVAAQATQSTPDANAPTTTQGQEASLKNEEKANKERAKAARDQRKALKAQDKAAKSAKKAGEQPGTTTSAAPSATPQ